MIKEIRIIAGGVALAAMLVAGPAAAERKAGDIIGRIGLTNVDPDSDNGDLNKLVPGASIDVDDDTAIGITGVYMFTDNIGLELLASTPFQHDISVAGTQVGSTDHLPPTLSVQWHFNSAGEVHPYLGLGLNYTNFFNEDANGALGVENIELDDSWGVAIQAGIDFEITERILLNVDVRWADIDTSVDVKAGGVWTRNAGTAEIDPVITTLSIGYKF